MAASSRAEEHFAAVDHDPADLDVGGAILLVGAASSEKGSKGSEHFASGPWSGASYQTASRVGQDQSFEFAFEPSKCKLVMERHHHVVAAARTSFGVPVISHGCESLLKVGPPGQISVFLPSPAG